jgi:Putative beta-barrel porin-2, OmpL-like. bbp2
MLRKGLLSVAFAVLAAGSTAFADSSLTAASSDPSAAQVFASAPDTTLNLAPFGTEPLYGDDAAAPSATPRAPLMWGLDQLGLAKPLDSLHINIFGYAEAGYLYDFTVPHNYTESRSSPLDFIYFPGAYKNSFVGDQIDLAIQRTIDASKGQFDVGFDVEAFYGRDAVYTHSNGILDNGNKHGDFGPDNDLDLEQAYLDFAIPIGSGLTITAGKFATLMGYETINPTTNALYTHSYEFSYGIPFTQTGVLGAYNITSSLALTAGITRGWNQSTDDNNGAIDFLGQLVWTVNSKLSLTANLSEGPESTDDNGDYWTVPEVIAQLQVSDQLKLAADLLYGDSTALNHFQWFGAAGYASYKVNNYATVNLRAEFYHDGRGVTTGPGVFVGGIYATDINYAEATLGVAITPLPSNQFLSTLTIRPEIRVDTADKPVYDLFNDPQYTQLTAAVDVCWKF